MYVKTTHLDAITGGWLTPSVGGALSTGTSRGQPVVPSLNLDVKEKNNEFQVAIDAPGMKKEGAFAVSGPTEGFDDEETFPFPPCAIWSHAGPIPPFYLTQTLT